MPRLLLLLVLFLIAGCTPSHIAEPTPPPPLQAPPDMPGVDPASPPTVAMADTVQAGRFDYGKMWTFENPPVDYLREQYGFSPDADWFERARMSALRLPGCSASFVSASGLVATNHHCARGSIVQVTREGENLLDDGFFARTPAEERPVNNYYVDQLVEITDVTARVHAAMDQAATAEARAEVRQQTVQAIQQEMKAAHGSGYEVQVVSLYDGGRFSAYTFRRYTDVRLVMAPEEQMGYFGGDYDNFTYPRYALDFAFFRIYDENGQPFDSSQNYFRWSTTGVSEDELVFVVGNPGSTNRLETVAQLEWRRDVQVPTQLGWITSRADAIRAYLNENPNDDGARNQLFSLLNQQKAFLGRRDALNDPYILARKRAAERQFLEALRRDPNLNTRYAPAIPMMETVQMDKLALDAEYRAFQNLFNPTYSSRLLRRTLLARQLLEAYPDNALPARDTEEERQLRNLTDRSAALDRRILIAEIEEVRAWQQARGLLDNVRLMSPEAFADQLLAESAFTSQARTQEAMTNQQLADDPAMQWLATFLPAYADWRQQMAALTTRENDLKSQLGRARYEVYGVAVPPDATFSLRFSDGLVRGYPYNGTIAPPFTTFYGVYDHYYSYGPDTPWRLPAKWLPIPPALDLATKLNFPATSDTIGGNSGSPMVNRNLELVGLNFDRTIEGLLRDYIYLPDRGRNVAVDARAVLEALDAVYDMDDLVEELQTGRLPNR